LAITFDNNTLLLTTAAEVSSHDDSIPRMNKFINKNKIQRY